MKAKRIRIILTFLICGVIWLSAGWAWRTHLEWLGNGSYAWNALPMNEIAMGLATLAGFCTVVFLFGLFWFSRRDSKGRPQRPAGFPESPSLESSGQVAGVIVLSVLAAILYGIIHDQITARICVEYFTIGHPHLIDSESPTMLGLFWGMVATWWVGLTIGIGLAIAARAGTRPQLTCSQTLRPIGILLCGMLGIAILAGLTGYFTSRAGIFHLVPRLAARIPEDKHVAFLTVGWAHSGSYLAGVVGGPILWIVTWRRRGKCALVG